MNVKNLLKILASISFERRILFSSWDIKKISYSILALQLALYPFIWHHIFIPILPESLIHYVMAPMPFIVGLHSSSLIALQNMQLEEVNYLFNIYKLLIIVDSICRFRSKSCSSCNEHQ